MLQHAFFQWGWLIAAILPLTQLGGRGLFNTLVSIYALWGLSTLWNHRYHLDRWLAPLYLALLGLFLLSIAGSTDPVRSIQTWLQFTVNSIVLLLVPIALCESTDNIERFIKTLALSGLLMLVGLYLMLPWYVLELSGEPFSPITQLKEDNLPFLLPFMLAGIWWYCPQRWRIMAMTSVTMVAVAYVALAEGRAALLGLVVGLTVFCWRVLNWRLWRISSVALLVLIAGIAMNSTPFNKVELDPGHPLDAFTAGRTILWQQALENPPVQPWLGVGIGNGRTATQMLSFDLGGITHQVRHLHNFVLDAWYETGFLGAGLLLALIATALIRLAHHWRCLSTIDQQRAGVLLAATLALMATGLLSFSYTTRQFSCYLFICLGGLSYFSQQHNTDTAL